MDLLRVIKNYFKPKVVDSVVYNPLFIPDAQIPASVFDRDVILWNYGFDEKRKVYKVLVMPYKLWKERSHV